MSEQLPGPEVVIEFFESTDFDDETKSIAAGLQREINALLHRHMSRCKISGVTKEQWLGSQKLALATCLRMRIDLK